jgi:hypothetical protein
MLATSDPAWGSEMARQERWGGAGVLQECYKNVTNVTRVLQGYYESVTRVLQGYYESVTSVGLRGGQAGALLTRCDVMLFGVQGQRRGHQGSKGERRDKHKRGMKGVRVVHGRYESVTRVLRECYESVTRVLQGRYKGVTSVFQGPFCPG